MRIGGDDRAIRYLSQWHFFSRPATQMPFRFNHIGNARRGYGECYHGGRIIRAWLRSLGMMDQSDSNYLQLPETIETIEEAQAFVERALVTPLGAAVRLHLHSSRLGTYSIDHNSAFKFVYFNDMLTPEEWRAFNAQERRLATAQVAHAHLLPCELAEMIARSLS